MNVIKWAIIRKQEWDKFYKNMLKHYNYQAAKRTAQPTTKKHKKQ